jgi:hypothetical protein
MLQELRLAVLALQKETGALVGLHCCANPAWAPLLTIGFDYLSFDVRLSLVSLCKNQPELRLFLESGGRLALGIVPTDLSKPYDVADVAALTRAILTENAPGVQQILEQSLLTPACGLALHSVSHVARVFSDLVTVQRELRSASGV